MQKIEKLIPDTSVIVEGLVSKKLQEKEIEIVSLIIHEAVLAELEHQANEGKAIGHIGLDEIEKLRKLSKNNFEILFSGKRPSAGEIKYASLGEIDALIRQLAYEEDATLMTADKIQAKVAQARGMKYILIEKYAKTKKLKLQSFFDAATMSVHLRDNTFPAAKKGQPGKWEFTKIRDSKIDKEEIKEISSEIIEEARASLDGFIEIEREGSTIVQLGKFRIVITRPPFSDGWEITAVRPVKHLSINDYSISEKLQKRLAEQAEGILIAGAPGMGKSTFAAALAEFYAEKGKIVKTIEAPRDLVLPDTITQYAISHGSSQEIHDILLLSRPDYTLFDEMRNKEDFALFADLRLSGIGLAGVIHATAPVDAIQRFVGKIELGVIPHIIDTVIFIKDGQINKVLSLQMEVKVPSGMTEADLARPVVTVTDFETTKLEFELYSYGEETVVVPVKATGKKSPILRLLEDPIKRYFQMYADDVDVEVISTNKAIVRVPEYAIPGIIGKGGKHIGEIEQELGLSLDIQELVGVEGNKKNRKRRKGNRRR
ncbi:Flp pilus assembly complex ATPase component TadA [Candidatus Woesearchaeota archaeon]|nr:Flp pilus assembly complex ATPase component TadA [Candidatus Woesearchaeota archaeon]